MRFITQLRNCFTIFCKRRKLFFSIIVITVAQLLASIGIFYYISLKNIQVELNKKINSIQKDVSYSNGKWDLSAYNTNRSLIGIYPLYLITLDGFILDRRSPIHGFLDTADFKLLLTYKNPKTLTTITNQKYRIFSQPIIDQKIPIGVIAVSYYNPDNGSLINIDNELIQVEKKIASMITIKQKIIDITKVTEKVIPYPISFTIVDRYNTVLNKTPNVNNIRRIPNFLDPSYIKYQYTLPHISIIKDMETAEKFLVIRSPFFTKQGSRAGIIIVGESLNNLFESLRLYSLINGLFSLLFLFSLLCVSSIFIQKNSNSLLGIVPKNVHFNIKQGILMIDGEIIKIPYATNQFYLLQALFSKPTKRWETDELLERFGENKENNNWRVIYDTMVKINKKVFKTTPIKLIVNQNKTYQLNSEILSQL